MAYCPKTRSPSFSNDSQTVARRAQPSGSPIKRIMGRMALNFWSTPAHAIGTMLAGWIHREPEAVVAYPKEEIRALREMLGGGRLRFTDAQRRRLARKARPLSHAKLRELGSLVTPDNQPAVREEILNAGETGSGVAVRHVLAHELSEICLSQRNQTYSTRSKLVGEPRSAKRQAARHADPRLFGTLRGVHRRERTSGCRTLG